MQIPFYLHQLGPQDGDAVKSVLATPFLTSGKVGRLVENQLAEYFGSPHTLLVNSWTNGAVATLLALDIGPGDEVIVPAMTFIATANVVELVGAKPVFVDVDPDTLLISISAVAAALTKRTKAIIAVHLYGQMVDIAALRTAIGERSNVAIIEDAAHCFEGELDGAKPGTYSDAAIFSFYATKNVTCGEGGAVTTRDPSLFAKLTETRLHGMSAGAIDRFREGSYRHWDMVRLGVKANLPDLLAALLGPQIARIDALLPERESRARRYEEALTGTVIRMPHRLRNGKHARHLFPIHVPPPVRDDALVAMAAYGVGCTVNYRSVPMLTYYREKYHYTPDAFPNSDQWGSGTLTLPLYPTLSADQQNYVIDAVLTQVVPLAERAME
jgi:UDP-4-amino-4-deoxy-L-arabinose-oxoglutarate aminotransferase